MQSDSSIRIFCGSSFSYEIVIQLGLVWFQNWTEFHDFRKSIDLAIWWYLNIYNNRRYKIVQSL